MTIGIIWSLVPKERLIKKNPIFWQKNKIRK